MNEELMKRLLDHVDAHRIPDVDVTTIELVMMEEAAKALQEAHNDLVLRDMVIQDRDNLLKAAEKRCQELEQTARNLHVSFENRTEHWLDEVRARKTAVRERDEARKALEWYANPEIYNGDGWSARPIPAIAEGGRRARAALEAK